jgi:site-specific DNA-methyltransferase (adenine-specific)
VTQAALVPAPAERSALAALEQARRLLARARTLDQARRIHDVAEAVRVYARQAELGLEIQNQAGELKLRAARRLGELLAAMPKNAGARGLGVRSRDATAPTLAELGVSKSQSSRWQAVAAVPEPDFERHLATTRLDHRELTTAGVLELARPHLRRARFQAVPPTVAAPLPSTCTLVVGDAARLGLPDGDDHGPRCAPADCPHPLLAVTSPPYCLGLSDRGYVDYLDYDAYLDAARGWASELYRVLQPNGRLALNVPVDTTRAGPHPVACDWLHILLGAGFRYRSTVIWTEGNIAKSTARGSLDSPSAINLICPAEVILVVHKGTWGLDRRDAPDLAHQEWLDWTLGCWSFAGQHADRVGYPAAFPPELPRRLIKLLSFPGDLVVDPFLGSGTTAVVAAALGRRVYGCDLNPDAVRLAQARVAGTAGGGVGAA